MGSRHPIQSFEELRKLHKQRPDEVNTTWMTTPNEDIRLLLRSVVGAVSGQQVVDGVEVASSEESPERLFTDVLHYMQDAGLVLTGQELQEGMVTVPPEEHGGFERVTEHGRYVLRFWVTERPR